MTFDLEQLPETSQASRSRLKFIGDTLQALGSGRVLDYGCGTGEHLTRPLAQHFPNWHITGIDPDQKSIQFARNNARKIPNLNFETSPPKDIQYDCIIASEVIEHVEDPVSFLTRLSSFMKEDAALILTLPNGYGPSEWMATLEACLTLAGVTGAVQRLKRSFQHGDAQMEAMPDTLAVSPHSNFFTLFRLYTLFSVCGFEPVRYRGRMLFYDLISARLMDRYESLAVLNARMGRCLPKGMVSDWMFVLHLRPASCAARGKYRYRRNGLERLRRYINAKRWGVL